MYGYTQTIGKQDTCVAGGVITGIPDTHTNSVVNVWTHTNNAAIYGHTQTIGKQETCVAVV